MKGVCKVCDLLDNDTTTKTITYCEFCSAWICERCEPNLLRRAKAFLKLKFNGSTKN